MRWQFDRETFELQLADEGADPVVRVAGWSMAWDKRRAPSHHLTVTAGDQRIEVAISPAGKNVRVFVQGREVHW